MRSQRRRMPSRRPKQEVLRLQAELTQLEASSNDGQMAAESCLISLQSQMTRVMGEMTNGGAVPGEVVASVRNQMETLFVHLQSISMQASQVSTAGIQGQAAPPPAQHTVLQMLQNQPPPVQPIVMQMLQRPQQVPAQPAGAQEQAVPNSPVSDSGMQG